MFSRINSLFKRSLLLLLITAMCLTSFLKVDVSALSGNLNRPFGGFQAKFVLEPSSGHPESSNYWWGVTQVDDYVVYCIDPLARTHLDAYYQDDSLIDRLEPSKKERLWQIAYFGYGFEGDKATERYMAAQELIWESMTVKEVRNYGGNDHFKVSWNAAAEGVSIDKINEYKEIITSLMKKHDKEPSFKGKSINVKPGEIVELIDENAVLDRYEFDIPKGLKLISKDARTLKLEVVSKNLDNVKISFYKKYRPQAPYTLVWGSGEDQKLFSAGLDLFDEKRGTVELNIPYGKIKVHKVDADTGDKTQGSASFADAEFAIIDLDTNQTIEVLKTDANGLATSKDILIDKKIKVCEIKAPYGYIKSETCVFPELADDKIIDVYIENEVKRGNVQVRKLDSETKTAAQGSATFKGAEFTIYLNGEAKETLITDDEGISNLSKDYPIGTELKICETKAPDGYEERENYCQYVIVKENETLNLEFKNDVKKGFIRIYKRDLVSGDELRGDSSFDGIEFILSAEGFEDQKLVLKDGSDYIDSERSYPIGTKVKIKEITNQYFNENNEIKEVEIKNAGLNEMTPNEVTFENELKEGKIEIIKFVKNNENGQSQIEKPAVNFEFAIYLKSSNELYETITTDEDGRAVSSYLPYGTYIVKEITEYSEGIKYDKLPDFEVEVFEDEKTYLKIASNYEVMSEAKFVKINGDTRIPMANMKFSLFDKDGNIIKMLTSYPKKEEITVFETNDEGYCVLPEKLKLGNYYLKEIAAPDTAIGIEGLLPITVDDKEVVIEITNDIKHAKIVIDKKALVLKGVDKKLEDNCEVNELYYESAPLSDTVWKIYAKEDIYANDIDHSLLYKKDDLVDTLVTTYEKTCSKELPLGKYYVKEIKTKDGYLLDEKIYEFDLTQSDEEAKLVELSSFNRINKVSIRFKKSFEFDEDIDVSKVKFALFNKDPLVDSNGEVLLAADSILKVGGIDENYNSKGFAELILPEGKYYIKEIATDDNYLLSEKVFEFEFAYGDEEVQIIDLGNIENKHRRFGKIEIHKTGEVFEGVNIKESPFGKIYEPYFKDGGIAAVFGIYAANNQNGYKKDELIQTITSDENGNAVSEELPLGEYYLKELSNDGLHHLDDQKYEFKIEYREDRYEDVKELSLKNERIKAEIILEKVFEDDSFEAYKETCFGIYSKEAIKNKDDQFLIEEDKLVALCPLEKSDDKYYLKSPDLPKGSYYLKELKTHPAYEVNEDIVEFEIAFDESLNDKTIDLEKIVNSKKMITVYLNKVDYSDTLLDGAIFGVYRNGEYLGDQVSGGIYLKCESGSTIDLSKDAGFNKFDRFKSKDEHYLNLDLAEGVYYTRINNDQNSIRKHVIKKGAICLEGIEYGDELIFEEIKAPEGYKIDDPYLRLEVKTDDNYLSIDRVNDLIIIPPNTGVKELIDVCLLVVLLILVVIMLTYYLVTRRKKMS